MASKMHEALEAIEEEREYQDKLWGPAASQGKHSVAEYILYMEDYLQEARNIVSRTASPGCDAEVLHILRKVAAMCVACMEQNGIRRRDMNDLQHACSMHGVCEEDD